MTAAKSFDVAESDRRFRRAIRPDITAKWMGGVLGAALGSGALVLGVFARGSQWTDLVGGLETRVYVIIVGIALLIMGILVIERLLDEGNRGLSRVDVSRAGISLLTAVGVSRTLTWEDHGLNVQVIDFRRNASNPLSTVPCMILVTRHLRRIAGGLTPEAFEEIASAAKEGGARVVSKENSNCRWFEIAAP